LTSDAPATIVWIAPAPPDEAQAGAVHSWARERGIALVDPNHAAPVALALDDRVADAIEELLGTARDAVVGHDRAGADRAIDAAEARLRAHAELPQAAWLMAEVERAKSTRWRRTAPVDAEAADRAWARAEALDEGRVAGVGEPGSTVAATPARIAVEAPPGDRVWIDGALVTTGEPAATRAGLHAVRATWRGRTVWATWIDVPGGDSNVALDAPGTTPCSLADTSSARVVDGAGGAHGVDAPDVLCPQWVAAAPGAAAGTVRVALCAAGGCGPLLDWHRPAPAFFGDTPSATVDHASRWPAWATWTLVGAGAAIAAGAGILASGVLKSPPGETIFVSGGLKTQ
jgi:hypothetical protein